MSQWQYTCEVLLCVIGSVTLQSLGPMSGMEE